MKLASKRDSEAKLEEQDRQIKERDERIKKLTEQLALEAAHLLLSNQRSDIQISTLSEENKKYTKDNTLLTDQVKLLTEQLAQKKEEIGTVAADNTRLRAQAAEFAKLKPHSAYLSIAIPEKQIRERDPSDRRTNFRLKRDVMVLATEVSKANPGTTMMHYNLHKEDLDQMEISEQNEVLTEHLHCLQEMLGKMDRIPPCDSFATPPPSALQTPASAAPTAVGVKRGRED